MEYSTNMVDLHHQPEELFLLNASTTLDWNQDLLLNGVGLIPINSRTLSNSIYEQHLIDPPSPTSSHHPVHDLGFQWSGHSLAKIKEEESPIESFLKLEQYQLSTEARHAKATQLNGLNSQRFSPPPPTYEDSGLDSLSLGMLLPGLNIQRACFPSTESPLLAMNTDALDILASTRFGRVSPAMACFENMSYGLPHQLHGAAQGGLLNLQQIPPPVNGCTEGKRAFCRGLDPLKPSKKPRLDSRPSFPPFKVRKEKLGDRIAALQQLVAPFGKTDTASVLMEAIGYIKFLQDQVETLSVPYMRPSSNNKLLTTEEVSTTNERDDSKPDLRSRGLCLVPLSCTSYVTNDNAVWSPPNFR